MLIDIELTRFKNHLKIKKTSQRVDVFDPVRRKYIALQPEELVRQLILHYLITDKCYPLSRIRVEMGLTVNELQKRCDILVFDKNAQPVLLVECKSIHVPIDRTVFEQIARYNLKFKVPYLITTNGISTFCCKMNYYSTSENKEETKDSGSYEFLEEIPMYHQVGVV